MSDQHGFDPELDDTLQNDPELLRIARMLRSTPRAQPPLDAEFRSKLRRQLMDQAWDSVEDRRAWWRGLFAPQRVAWAAAAAVVVLVASIVLYTATQEPGQLIEKFPTASSPLQDQPAVSTHQAIELRFSQAMDHPSTEAAVQITPATSVAYSWSGDTVLYVQPTSGNLAPNTQYQVTVGAGARTQAGVKTPAPQTVTFVTTGEAAPTPSPSPSPSPTSNTGLLTNVSQLTGDYPPQGTTYPVVWSRDSSTVYFVGSGGALESISVKGGGSAKTLVPDGASLPAITKAGDRLAYVRGGKIEILDLTAGTTTEVAVDAAPTTLTWVNDQLYWGTSSAVYRLDAGGPVKVVDVGSLGGAVLSVAPDGTHAIVQVSDGLSVVDVTSGKSNTVCGGGCATTFQGWSPDGSRFIYGGNIADPTGHSVSSVPPGDASWSAVNEILLGSDTNIFEVRSDGTEYTKLADGTFHSPVWAPDGTTFAFVRGSQLWVASAPAATAPPAAVDQALRVVRQFMQARLDGQSDRAMSFLDANGKNAYAGTSPALIPQGDPAFHRSYILMSEVDPITGSVHVVVRLVFSHGKVEQLLTEETLTLVREQETDPYLIDGAVAGPQLETGKGPQVVAVKVSPTEVDVTFDSDLNGASVSGNVSVQDANGAPVGGSVSYDDRTVSLTGLQLTPGTHYRLVVLPAIEDVGNHNAPAEYDLDLIGPAPAPTAGGVTPPPSPSPSPSPSSSPSPAVTPSGSPGSGKKS
jgi:hypothetical protein